MTTPSYRLLPLQPHLQALQQDATTEVLTLFPVEKRKGLMSYGLPESCGKLCEALLQNVVYFLFPPPLNQYPELALILAGF